MAWYRFPEHLLCLAVIDDGAPTIITSRNPVKENPAAVGFVVVAHIQQCRARKLLRQCPVDFRTGPFLLLSYEVKTEE